MKHDYAAASAALNGWICDGELLTKKRAATDALTRAESSLCEAADTILHALRFAEKMMKKPSEEAIEAGWNAFGGPDATFKAMRDQALKELGE